MKTLYLECNMGAAGDMLMAALYELVEDKQGFLKEINGLGLPGVKVAATDMKKCGIKGSHITVTVHGEEEGEGNHHHNHAAHHHHHHGHGMAEIEKMIEGLPISRAVKEDAVQVYKLIAEAESEAHGMDVDEIHFHEVGTMDAVTDVVGVCMLMARIAPDKIVVSPVNTGFGWVHCAHGVLPVPAPATAHILRGIPSYSGSCEGELCTPTGAALIKHFAGSVGRMPEMKVRSIGHGMGTKDFEKANLVRAFLGEEDTESEDKAAELTCSIDDMTAEDLGFAMEALLKEGALDVYATAAVMKKSRPGWVLTCLCGEGEKEKFAKLIFKHTSTIGIRQTVLERYVLKRHEEHRTTDLGSIKFKISEGYGVRREKAEHDDLTEAAQAAGLSLEEVRRKLKL